MKDSKNTENTSPLNFHKGRHFLINERWFGFGSKMGAVSGEGQARPPSPIPGSGRFWAFGPGGILCGVLGRVLSVSQCPLAGANSVRNSMALSAST